jgi:predicted DCC family thiol-disulfide oxidoreductase YuxK
MMNVGTRKEPIMQPSQSVSNQAIVLYDGACPLCRKSVAILQRLDWRRRLTYQDARDVAHLPESAVPLEPARLLQEMHLLTPGRTRVYAGYPAFRWMAGRLPPLWLLWPFLFVPGVPWLGQRLYRWVAKNRYNLVPCRDGACTAPQRPAKAATEQIPSLPRTPSA